MKKEIVINNQKLKFYSINQLRYSDRMKSNFREEISDKDTLVNYILEQLKCNKVDEVRWSCFLQELMGCVEIEQVPETFEELKELCMKLEPKLVKENNLYETQITLNINNGGYYAFYPDGTIIFKASNSINYTIAKNKTMSQMFQFIKSLIGEE